jgi:hypothetical protein
MTARLVDPARNSDFIAADILKEMMKILSEFVRGVRHDFRG